MARVHRWTELLMRASKIGLLGGTLAVIISSNQSKYNLRTAMGSPSGPQRIIVTINSGVEITSDDAAVPAFDEGSGWASGTVITIINNGKIYGMGGAGGSSETTISVDGSGLTSYSGRTSGSAGGTALALRVPTTVDNGAGEIFGGGGGGGAGATIEGAGETDLFIAQGGGGGGGRGSTTSTGGDGTASFSDPSGFVSQWRPGTDGSTGSSAALGAGGAGGVFSGGDSAGSGGSGGDWGASGSSGSTYTEAIPGTYAVVNTQTSGGAGGNAVALNGNSVTWLAGNTGARVKGAVS